MRSFAFLLSLSAFTLSALAAHADPPPPAAEPLPATLPATAPVPPTAPLTATAPVSAAPLLPSVAPRSAPVLASAAATTAGQVPPRVPGFARIHITSPDPRVQLWHRLGDGVDDVLCRAPCDLTVDGRKGDEFSFAGSGLSRSAPFLVFDKEGDLTAEVRPGNNGSRVGGIVSFIAGATSMVLGGIGLGVGANDNGTVSGSGNGATAFGAVALGTGAAAAIVGLYLLLSNRTTYEIHPSTSAPPASPHPLPTPSDTPLPAPGAATPATLAPAVPPIEEALPADDDACELAAEYDRRAAAASEPAKTQLLRIAAHKHKDCERLRAPRP